MKPRKLTTSAVSALPTTGARYAVRCTSIIGFEIRVGSTGAKSACVVYRRGGKLRRYNLGRIHEGYPVAQARADAAAVLLRVKAGADPATERSAEREAPTFSSAADRYMEDVRARKKPATIKSYEKILRLYLRPAFGDRQVTAIDAADARRLHARMHGTPAAANQAIILLGAIMKSCETTGLRPKGSNPCQSIQLYTQRARSRVATSTELARLDAVLADPESLDVWRGYVDAFRLLLLTTCRVSEIVNLTWSEVDIDRSILALRDSKSGARTVPLSRQAVAYLRKLHDGRGSSAYVCPNYDGGPLTTSIRRIWHKVRLRAGVPDLTLHDLRRTGGTIGVEDGVPLALMSGVLGHAQTKTTETFYVHPNLAAQIEAAQAMGDAIEHRIKAGKLTPKKDQ